MPDQRIRPLPADLSPEHSDQITRSAVLLIALDLHPIQVTVSELIRQLSPASADFGERDRVERAVLDLAGVGLLHRHDFLNRPDALVTPTLAAISADELLDV